MSVGTVITVVTISQGHKLELSVSCLRSIIKFATPSTEYNDCLAISCFKLSVH